MSVSASAERNVGCRSLDEKASLSSSQAVDPLRIIHFSMSVNDDVMFCRLV